MRFWAGLGLLFSLFTASAWADETKPEFTIFGFPATGIRAALGATQNPANYDTNPDLYGDLQLFFIGAKGNWNFRAAASGMGVDNKVLGKLEATASFSNELSPDKNMTLLGVDVLDTAVQGSQITGLQDYMQAKTSVYVGRVHKVGKTCKVEILGVAGIAWFDSLQRGEKKLYRPTLGSRGGLICSGGLALRYNAQFATSFAYGNTTKLGLDAEKTWSLKSLGFGKMRAGFFANFNDIIEGVAPLRTNRYVVETYITGAAGGTVHF